MQEGVRHIIITDLVLDASIGVNPEEKLAKQKLIINLDIAVAENEAPVNDRIENVVCYDTIISAIKKIFENSGHVELLETASEKIASICLENKNALTAKVRVEKPDIYSDVSRVGIEVFRENKN
ncbi:MAG: dihydroneopterin aldolase [Alphaproteobacteria bacterium]|nr:dihydroneopterin aldolase [Alphaproteobacteria bacterium]